MHRLFEVLRPFIRGTVRQARWVLLAALLLSAASAYLAAGLSIDTDISNLVPESYESVQALETLQRTVGGESDMAVAIVSPSFEANKRFAEALIPRALSLKRANDTSETYLTRVDYKREVGFLKNNALYFASHAEMRQVEQFLDDQIEEARQARREANPFYFELDTEDDTTGEATAEDSGQQLEGVYDRLIGKRYPISDDSTTLVLRFFPSGANTNIGYIENLYADTRALVDRMGPEAYHPEMKVVLAGRLYRQLVEVSTIWEDVTGSFGVGVGTVLLVVILYFLYKAYRARGRFGARLLLRAPIMGLVISVPLFMSLLWTGAVAEGLFGRLNLMTSTLGLILFGLGIDFGIHFYGRYSEERADGRSLETAAEETFVSTGQAIAVGAFTTAGALYVLTMADFKGFSEFGAVAGTGVLFALGAMTVVMPALLAVLERTGLLHLEGAPRPETEGTGPARRYPAARPLVLGGLLAVVAALALAPRVGFQYDFGALEPAYTEYEARDRYVDRASSGGNGRRNPAYIVADSAAAVPEIVEAVRQKMRADTTSPTILAVESLQERFHCAGGQAGAHRPDPPNGDREPLPEGRNHRRAGAAAARRPNPRPHCAGPGAQVAPKEVYHQGGRARQVRPDLSLRGPVRRAQVHRLCPGCGHHHDRRRDPLLCRLHVAGGGGHADASAARSPVDDWGVVPEWLNFRSVRWAALALVPLVVGLLWMLLVMEVFGLMVNFYNMIVFPAILGIGNDAGVHMAHRYREEGAGSLWTVLRSTGEHVTMGTLTTMVGFGGLLLSFHPGLNSMGTLAVLGLGTTLLAATVFLPALLQWLEDRNGIFG